MKRTTTVSCLFALLAGVPAWAQSVWLPAEGEFVATPGFFYSTFDEFWMGKTKVSNPPNGESLDQYTAFVTLEYGLVPRLAADVTVGYTGTETEAFGDDSDDGMADTHIGLRYAIWDENSAPAALGIRVGGIIPGTYDENLPFSAGDGAYGLEGSLQAGKRFGESGFGLYGDIGYRFREGGVPDDLFGSAGVFKQFGGVFADADAITLSVGYRHVQGLSGGDIGDPGFGTEFGFPEVREINQLVEGSVAYTDAGGRQYQFTVAGSVDGRNTGDKLIFGLAVSLPFQTR